LRLEDVWADNGGVKLHYLRSGDAAGTPLIYLPGALGSAEQFRDEMVRLAPRPVVSVSLRGVGKSDAPAHGYCFEDLVSDLRAVLDHAALPPFCLMAFSRGVPIALRYAAAHPHALKGLILLDYPARYRKIPESWVLQAKRWVEQVSLGVPSHVIEQLQRESDEVALWEELPAVACPVLIIRGGQPGALLNAEDAARYLGRLPTAREVVFEDAGHEVYKPDYERFMRTVEAFLGELDGGLGGGGLPEASELGQENQGEPQKGDERE